MIIVFIALAGAYLLGVHVSPDASIVALAIGMVSDSVRSNRIKQAEAGREALRAYAKSLVERGSK